MKKRGFFTLIRQDGILRWSTACILAGGMVGLTGCERKYVATEQDANMAKRQSAIEALDARRSQLMHGEVPNNFNLPGVGYYHAEVRDFFEHPYGYQKDGRWFANGRWQDYPVTETPVAASRPTPEALKTVEAALEREQQQIASQSNGAGNTAMGRTHQGSGVGNALMMYWLLSGNRGSFNPGVGFQRAGSQAGTWQRDVDNERNTVRSYASSHPGYSRVVSQSHSTGAPVKAGQSVRGGFGSSGRSSSAS